MYDMVYYCYWKNEKKADKIASSEKNSWFGRFRPTLEQQARKQLDQTPCMYNANKLRLDKILLLNIIRYAIQF